MHIPDGILPLPVTLGGYAVSAAVAWYALRRIGRQENPRAHIPRAALLTVVFMVASWISVPIPPATVHFLFVGLMGLLLGYYAYPAILIALIFQAVMFQHGGITTIGVNSLCFGLPALLAHALFGRIVQKAGVSVKKLGLVGFFAGMFGTALSVLIFFTILILFIPADLDVVAEQRAIALLTLAHIPLIAAEGVFSALLLMYLYRIKPKLLEAFI